MFFGPPEVWGLVSLIGVSIAVYEWCKLVPSRFSAASPAAALTAGIGVAWMLLAHAFPGQTLKGFVQVLCLSGMLYWLVFGSLALKQRKPAFGGKVSAVLCGLICWLALLELRRAGIGAVFSAIAIVCFADIGAYFVGRAFGKRKLAPYISPGKSWEGAIGGAFLVLILGLTLAAAPMLSDTLNSRMVAKWSSLVAVPMLLLMVYLSVLGDLHESLLKRIAGVKDSGKLLPGHGGFFDRTDALIPAMPAAYLFWSISV